MQTETLDAKTLDGHKAHFIAGHGGYPLVGTAEQIVDELGKLADIGVDGCLISWVDYKERACAVERGGAPADGAGGIA